MSKKVETEKEGIKRVEKEVLQKIDGKKQLEKELRVQITGFKGENTIRACFYTMFRENKTFQESKSCFVSDYGNEDDTINLNSKYFKFQHGVKGGYIDCNMNDMNKVLVGKFGAIDITGTYPYYLGFELPYGDLLEKEPIEPHYTFLKIKIKCAKKKAIAAYVPNFLYQPEKDGNDVKYVGDELRYVSHLENVTVYYIKEEGDFICNFYDVEAEVEPIYYCKKKVGAKKESEEFGKMRQPDYVGFNDALHHIGKKYQKQISVACIGYFNNGVIDKQRSQEEGIDIYKKRCQVVYPPVNAVITMLCRLHIGNTIIDLIRSGAIGHLCATDSIFFEANKIEFKNDGLVVNNLKIVPIAHSFGNFYGTGEGDCKGKLIFDKFGYNAPATYLCGSNEVGNGFKIRGSECKMSKDEGEKQRLELFNLVVRERKNNIGLKKELQSHDAYQLFKETYLGGKVDPVIETPVELVCETIRLFTFDEIMNNFDLVKDLVKFDYFKSQTSEKTLRQKCNNINKNKQK